MRGCYDLNWSGRNGGLESDAERILRSMDDLKQVIFEDFV